MKKITIRDVAKLAGVGLGTVSRVLNNSDRVKDSTRQRVLEAMDELGYKPSAIARQLARKTRPQNIGVVTRPFLKDYYSFAERLRGVQRAVQDFGEQYEIMLFSTSSMGDYEDRLSNIVQTGMIDGLLLIDLTLTVEQETALEIAGIPFVGLTHEYQKHPHYLGTDNIAGGYLATDFLIRLGHRRIAYMGDLLEENEGFVTGIERFKGYRKAMIEHELVVKNEYVLFAEHGYEQAYETTFDLIQGHLPPSAIFAMSDTQALGCMAAIRAAGLRVPEDISVIGYDNLEISYHVGLTSVNQNLELSGKIAATYLFRLMTNKSLQKIPQLPSLTIVERQTTRPITQDEVADDPR